MSKYHDKAVELRAIQTPHYNCCQSVVVPFIEDAGIPEDFAMKAGANFGAGMKMASICGAVSGGIMTLGFFGIEDPAIIGSFYRKLKENHEGFLDCANLLRLNKEQGGEKKPHCDAMVYECVDLVEAILRENGKIK